MTQTVLILDDEPDIVWLMERLIAAHLPGVQTKGFTAPLDALAWCAAHEPDLCLVDYRMPGMSGLDFIACARGLPGFDGVPMVMITANFGDDLQLLALSKGATEFLAKPFRPEEVAVRLRNLLALRRTWRARQDQVNLLAGELEAQDNSRLNNAVAHEQERIIERLCHVSQCRDEETGNHMRRMAHIARLVAVEMGRDAAFCDRLVLAAPMHDIGKVGIPDRILLKRGKLDASEWEIMKTHTRIGHDVLKDSQSPLLRMAADIAVSHHERFDGSGYPSGRASDAIPLVGRIVALADVFDALVSERCYKTAWTPERALEYVRAQAGVHFDPVCVEAFVNRFDDAVAVRARYADDSVCLPSDPAVGD